MQYLTSLNSSSSINLQPDNNHYLKLTASKNKQLQKKTKPPKKKLSVLVVEDEPINQYVAKSLLESKGFSVDIAPTGQAALELYQANAYAAILMDMGLPDLPGTEVARQIRTFEKATGKHIPIIACTANGLRAKPECLAAGMDDFSVKPVELEALNQLLKTWIEKSK